MFAWYCQNLHKAVEMLEKHCLQPTTILVKWRGAHSVIENARIHHIVEESLHSNESNVWNMFRGISAGISLAVSLNIRWVLRLRIDMRVEQWALPDVLNPMHIYGHRNPFGGNMPSDNVAFGSTQAIAKLFTPLQSSRNEGMPEVIIDERIKEHGYVFQGLPVSVFLTKPITVHHKQRSSGIRHWWTTPNETQPQHEWASLESVSEAFTAPSPMCPLPLRTAVCITGPRSTFLEKAVQDTLMYNFHYPEYEYFLSTDAEVEPNDPRVAVKLAGIFADNGSPVSVVHPEEACANVEQYNKVHRYPMVSRFVPCYDMILQHEQQHGFIFDLVARVGTDLVYVERLPSLHELFASLALTNDLLLWDEDIAVMPRAAATEGLLVPQRIYRSCATVAQWQRACAILDLEDVAAAVRSRHAPCCPMNLIAVFSDVTVRQCGPVNESACLSPGSISKPYS
jgi:hypothetical protein